MHHVVHLSELGLRRRVGVADYPRCGGAPLLEGDRRVSSVISLGANTRNGGPQNPVPRLV
jgi:hypothetical protein